MLILVAVLLVFSIAPSPNLKTRSLSRFKDYHVCVGLQQCTIFSLSLLDNNVTRVECYVAHGMGFSYEMISHLIVR